MSRSTLDIVCDAGPLIHLDELGCLDLLADFQTVLVPEQVWQEVETHRPGALERFGVRFQRTSGGALGVGSSSVACSGACP